MKSLVVSQVVLNTQLALPAVELELALSDTTQDFLRPFAAILTIFLLPYFLRPAAAMMASARFLLMPFF
jgi:hypothetical protein